MKVLHVTAHDNGGAGEAAYRVHEGLKKQRIESRFLSMYKLSKKMMSSILVKNSKLSNFLFKLRHKLESDF